MPIRICNVAHQSAELYRGQPFDVVVPGRGDPLNEELEYGEVLVPDDVWSSRDIGFGERVPILQRGEEHAHQMVHASPGKWDQRGVFICKNPEGPTAEELAKATETYRKWMREQFVRGKEIWKDTGKQKYIPTECKLAAIMFREKVEWAGQMASDGKNPCPNCGELIPVTLAIHLRTADGVECGAVLDDAKARQLKIGPYAVAHAKAQKSVPVEA